MKSLPPLVVRLLMAMGAILCVGEGPGLNKVVASPWKHCRAEKACLCQTGSYR